MPQSPFVSRHIGPNDQDIANMLAELGYSSLDSLTEAVVPPGIQMHEPLALPDGADEHEALQELHSVAKENQRFRSLIGMGYYNTRVPAVIQRNVLENPGWYTAYTPYQPEIAQGRLEGLLNFQQMVCDLTGMALANASMLDEATAVAEAMTMCKRQQRKNRSQTFFVDAECHPQTLAVVRTRAEFFGFDIIVGDPTTDLDSTNLDNIELFGAVIQYPGSTGVVRDLEPIIEQIHRQGALAVVATDLMSLLLLTPPGELGADVVVGSAQRFGVPMGFGGPHAAFFAFRDEYKRSAPGRIIGVSIDSRGKTALRMAMQTREQHIRREKANSNICTSQVLLALMSAFYTVYHGPRRLRAIASRIHDLTNRLAASLNAAGHIPVHEHWFDTLCLDVGARQTELLDAARQRGINLRAVGDDRIGISLDECSDEALLVELLEIFSAAAVEGEVRSALPSHLLRTSAYLEHPIFNSYHSETEMLRYLKRLESRDIALNQAMIPLGSCTMKLNATAEMVPITWPQFAELHPFAPAEQAAGYQRLFRDLEHWLAVCTGYDAVSLQPNAGSQGEYAGLLAIQRYHQSRGEHQRTVCLIPSSAHGTNPASAQMVGIQVVVVECDAKGNVDVADLTGKAEQYSEQLSALMITYPSTHGVFEEGIRDICDVIHRHGGQVYIDGANMNAMVGLAEPGRFGGDVSHLNLHKTFCIPHGGGGPGMGPIGVREHLAPFLPGHVVTPIEGADNGLTISAAAYGSASILPIPWMYVRMMGAAGLRRATQVAILSANYIARKLAPAYPILYSGRDGLVAHECLIDLRSLKESSGITEEDVAKRLMDFGFHAPTMSFPVAGTLMIEPTESESREELDRFIQAMLIIRDEIAKVETGEWPADDNPLKHAPHTQDDVLADDWQRPYSRERAARPAPWLKGHKVWPYVNRIDNVYGDRHLVCSCPPMDSYR